MGQENGNVLKQVTA